ncbi:LA_3696 family protein [Dehalococcoides sp.]|uniref:LA_3696 family protein n=1 Tax=Dehalococcoides sp. TaxID=1966486 RepID=UPI003566508B
MSPELSKIPSTLREKLGEDGVDALIELLDKVTGKTKEETMEILSERTGKKLAELEGNLLTKIESVRSEIIKWMFVFWIGQIAVLTAIFKLIII